jgi:DNA polymerase I
MFLALDTDILMYKAAQAAETEIEWEQDIWTLYCDLKDAKDAFVFQVNKIQQRLDVKDAVFCISDYGNNYRKELEPTYKAGRKGTRKPVGYRALVDWVQDSYKTLIKPSLEADDCMGILATMPINKGKCIVVSDDKDLKTIPCKLYRPMSDELMTVTEEEADAFFYTQTLTGDAVDNVKGLAGVGEKTAAKILGNRPSWGAVEQAYIKAGLTKEDAIHQARLVRILRWSDWDEKKENPILWTPTK